MKDTGHSSLPCVLCRRSNTADARRNLIDAFVIARLDADGIAPAQQADRRTLIRGISISRDCHHTMRSRHSSRTPAPDNDAYEKLADRLLDSPRFGEHQARYWLDAARYARIPVATNMTGARAVGGAIGSLTPSIRPAIR
ncbi:MAG: DUF1549 domain-containing protein [Verrucomicrobiales bacterium]